MRTGHGFNNVELTGNFDEGPNPDWRGLKRKGASELERVGIKLIQEGVAIKRSRETGWHLEINTDV